MLELVKLKYWKVTNLNVGFWFIKEWPILPPNKILIVYKAIKIISRHGKSLLDFESTGLMSIYIFFTLGINICPTTCPFIVDFIWLVEAQGIRPKAFSHSCYFQI